MCLLVSDVYYMFDHGMEISVLTVVKTVPWVPFIWPLGRIDGAGLTWL